MVSPFCWRELIGEPFFVSIFTVLSTVVRIFNCIAFLTVDSYTFTMLSIDMSLESTVGTAKIGTKSLRATIPEGIVVFLEIKEGDKLQWKMDMKDNERMVIVKKSSKDKDSVELAKYSLKQKRKRLESDFR